MYHSRTSSKKVKNYQVMPNMKQINVLRIVKIQKSAYSALERHYAMPNHAASDDQSRKTRLKYCVQIECYSEYVPFDVSSLANPKTKGPVRAIGQKIYSVRSKANKLNVCLQ